MIMHDTKHMIMDERMIIHEKKSFLSIPGFSHVPCKKEIATSEILKSLPL